jgi:hypothetical protein
MSDISSAISSPWLYFRPGEEMRTHSITSSARLLQKQRLPRLELAAAIS